MVFVMKKDLTLNLNLKKEKNIYVIGLSGCFVRNFSFNRS